MFKAGDRVRRLTYYNAWMTPGSEWTVLLDNASGLVLREIIGTWTPCNFELVNPEPFPLLVRLSSSETRIVRSAADFPPTPFTVLETGYKEPELIVGRMYRHVHLSETVLYELRGVVDGLPVFKTRGSMFVENAVPWYKHYKIVPEMQNCTECND